MQGLLPNSKTGQDYAVTLRILFDLNLATEPSTPVMQAHSLRCSRSQDRELTAFAAMWLWVEDCYDKRTSKTCLLRGRVAAGG